jgi:hypothetical protein
VGQLGENPAVTFLQTPHPGTPSELISDYTNYLLSFIECDRLPVSLNAIRKRLNLRVRRTPLPGQRGCTNLALSIFVNSDDRLSVQRFTVAHEFIEVLFFAIADDAAADWMDDDLITALMDRKEELCEFGAAELTMPLPLFSKLTEERSINLDTARDIAKTCQVSLTAGLHRMIDTRLIHKALVIWQYKHKPTDRFPSRIGQGALFGPPESMDPVKRMRVARAYTPPDFVGYIPVDKSVPATSLIQQAFDSAATAAGFDDLGLDALRGRYYVEAMPFQVEEERYVMSLIHLDRSGPQSPQANRSWKQFWTS